MANNEEGNLIRKAVHVGESVVHAAVDASRLKAAASHVVEDAVTDARRLARRGRYAAEDLVDETAHRIKREPFRAIAITLAIGLSVGALAGWLAHRSSLEK